MYWLVRGLSYSGPRCRCSAEYIVTNCSYVDLREIPQATSFLFLELSVLSIIESVNTYELYKMMLQFKYVITMYGKMEADRIGFLILSVAEVD